MASLDQLQAVVDNLIAKGGEVGVDAGIYPSTPFFEKIKKNVIAGSGAQLKIPVTSTKGSVTAGQTPRVSVAGTITDNLDHFLLSFDYFTKEEHITNSEIDHSSDAEVGSLLRVKLNDIALNVKETINTELVTGDGATGNNIKGLKSLWTGNTYGSQNRDTAGNGSGTFYQWAASSTAYDVDAASGGMVKFNGGGSVAGAPAAQQTRWDCAGASYNNGGDPRETALNLISTAYGHVSHTGDRPDVILVGKDVYALLLEFLNNKGNISTWGLTKSITATGGDDLVFRGASVVEDSAMATDEAFVLNTKYFVLGTPSGSLDTRMKPKVTVSPSYIDAKMIYAQVPLVMGCRNLRKNAWLENIPLS